MNKLVGVIGGMGPEATVTFMETVIKHTDATRDQEHVDMLVYQMGSCPDRTTYILDNNNENPIPYMIKAAKFLENSGCSFIVMPCNTATYFYDQIVSEISIPFINIIEETVNKCLEKKAKKIGLMATNGTIYSKSYDKYIPADVELFIPDNEMQIRIMDTIYKEVKGNKEPNKDNFEEIIQYFKDNGCDVIIIGCTDLSVLMDKLKIDDPMLVDSLTVLAKETVLKSGKLLK